MDTSCNKADVGAVSDDENEHTWQTHSSFNEKVLSDLCEKGYAQMSTLKSGMNK